MVESGMDSEVAQIYALCEPGTVNVRYVGKSKTLRGRLKSHKNDKGSTRRSRWIRSLKRAGKEPTCIVIDEVPNNPKESWEKAEVKWIKFFRSMGFDLTNHTRGGDGLSGLCEESRRKLSAIQKKRLENPEYRKKIFTPERSKKISESLRGKKKTKKHVAKLPQNQKGYKRNLSEETKSRLSEAGKGNKRRLGKTHFEEDRKRISEGLKSSPNRKRAQKLSESHKKAIGKAQAGKEKTEEHKEKMRQAALKRWQKVREESGNAD